jgi:hypothetical protein
MDASSSSPKRVEVPLGYPTSTIYLDDSGTKAAGTRLLVIGGLKVRRHGQLLRAIRHVREQTGFGREFKFAGINKGSLSAYYALIDEMKKSDAHLVACVSHRPDPGSSELPASCAVASTSGSWSPS